MKKFKTTAETVKAVVKNSKKKIKKQGGSPSEISNRRKTQYKIIKDANKELKKLGVIGKGK